MKKLDRTVIYKAIVSILAVWGVLYCIIHITGHDKYKLTDVGEIFRSILMGNSLNKLIVLLIFMISLVIVLYNVLMLLRKDEELNEKVLLISSLFLVGSIYAWIAINLKTTSGPDEYMRYDISYWIYKNGKLPIGDEAELINPIWGLSYGFTPCLPSIISAIFMKIASLFTLAETKLLIAARMTSVLSGVGVFYFATKLGELFLDKKYSKYLFAYMIALIPQFAFMCGYHNNDTLALMSVIMIIYAWLNGIKKHWGIKQTVFLAGAISICLLCYYNAYGYILCSIFVCVISVLFDAEIKDKWRFLLSRIAVVFTIVLVLAGWFFVRNAVLHDGDFLGVTASRECAEIYAQDDYKPSQRQTLKNTNQPITGVTESEIWKEMTVKSTIGYFGYMAFQMLEREYALYILIFMIGLFLSIQYFVINTKKRIWLIPFITCAIIPILINIYYSYANDWEPQGRYSFSCIPVVALMAASGYESFMGENDKVCKRVNAIIILIMIMTLAVVIGRYLVPNCFGVVLE